MFFKCSPGEPGILQGLRKPAYSKTDALIRIGSRCLKALVKLCPLQ